MSIVSRGSSRKRPSLPYDSCGQIQELLLKAAISSNGQLLQVSAYESYHCKSKSTPGHYSMNCKWNAKLFSASKNIAKQYNLTYIPTKNKSIL